VVSRASRLLWVVLLSVWLAGCGTPTPYQAATDGFGYSDQQLENNRFRVSFAGNSLTRRGTVQDYLLYRAAELTLEHHHDYFTIVNQNLERSTAYQGTGYNNFGFWPWRPGWIGPSNYAAYPVDSYTAFADIVMGDGPKPAGNLNSFNARDVIHSLGPTIVRPKEGSS
jgi:hypothetical protein